MDLEKPLEIEIQFTREEAIRQVGDDEDSLDEEALSNVDWEIGQSKETIEINSWAEIPEGYEPVKLKDRRAYLAYQERKSYEDSDE